jgi:uncharacterized membrane protein YciS (DUF1049 family)
MKLSTIIKIVFAIAFVGVLIWLIIGEIQFQQMKSEVQKTSWLRRILV